MFDKTPQVSGEAADLGTVVHAVAERWVKENHYQAEPIDADIVKALYDDEYHKLLADNTQYADGLAMCLKWVNRTDWSDRKVLSTEEKTFFNIKLSTSTGPLVIPVNYIWDRCDELICADGGQEIEIIDYKTVRRPVTAEQMRARIQVRLYALAGQIRFPQARRIWVTYDLLRYDQVSVAFTKDQNLDTWRYINNQAAKIVNSDGTEERLNNECKFCIRKGACETLAKHLQGAGSRIGQWSDPFFVAGQRAELAAARDAASALVDELDTFLLAHMEKEDITAIETDQVEAHVSVGSRKHVDAEQVERILGNRTGALFPTGITATKVEALLKTGGHGLTDLQARQLRGLIRKMPGAVSIKTTIKV